MGGKTQALGGTEFRVKRFLTDFLYRVVIFMVENVQNKKF
jgi:hypothetical protein